MRKIIALVSFVFLSIHMKAQEMPKGVTMLGDFYSVIYSELVNKLTAIENNLNARKGTFASYDQLLNYICNEWNQLSGSEGICQTDITKTAEFLLRLQSGGSNYSDLIASSAVSGKLKIVLTEINKAIESSKKEEDIYTFLEEQAAQISSFNLSGVEEENLKMYITGLYANFHVVKNSNLFSGEAGKGFWGWVGSVLKCIFGTVGGGLLGLVNGAGAGTITLPGVGTVSGAVAGAWGGLLVGASTSCL